MERFYYEESSDLDEGCLAVYDRLRGDEILAYVFDQALVILMVNLLNLEVERKAKAGL